MKRISDRLSRMTLLTALPLSLFCFIPQPVLSQIIEPPPATALMDDILQSAFANDQDALQDTFREISQAVEASDDPITTTRAYLEAFVAEANARTGGSLTVADVLKTVKEHLNVFQVPLADQAAVIKAIETLEKNEPNHAASEWRDAVACKHGHHHHHCNPWKVIGIAIIAITAICIAPPAAVAIVDGSLGIAISLQK
jgi:hypothetical protein